MNGVLKGETGTSEESKAVIQAEIQPPLFYPGFGAGEKKRVSTMLETPRQDLGEVTIS